jgi:putative membrane protein
MFKHTIVFALLAGLVACDADRTEQPRSDRAPVPAADDQAAPPETPEARQAPAEAVSEKDRDFVRTAASAGMFEVQSSEHALERREQLGALAPFATKMVEDHKKANEELKSLAQRKNVEVPTELLPKHRDMMKEVENASDLSRTYADVQLKAHEEAVELFEDCSKNCNDAEIKAFAERTLKVLHQHHEDIQARAPRAGN